MLVVITYDVNTETTAGRKRLRQVAKICERYGIRVQNSVFEVEVDAAHLAALKAELIKRINIEQDSVRIYRLGNSYEHKIETLGKTPIVQAGGALFFDCANRFHTSKHGRLAQKKRQYFLCFAVLHLAF